MESNWRTDLSDFLHGLPVDTPKRAVCGFTWTTDNEEGCHFCPLAPGHADDHICDIADCMETYKQS